MTENRVARTIQPAAFLATAFGMSWAVWIPLLLIRLEVLPPVIPVATLTQVGVLGVVMPFVAATWLTARAAGRPGLRALYSRLGLWRAGRWWIAVLLIQPVVLVVTAVVHNALGRGEPVRTLPGLAVGTLLTSVVFLLIASTGEEVGWRGLALPSLQERYGPVRASLVLGLATATWHVPYWILQGVMAQYGLVYLSLDFVFVVALTLQLTWLFNHTTGSILVAVAFHVVFNTVNVAVLPVTASTGAFALLTVVEAAISLALVSHLAPPAAPHDRGVYPADTGPSAGRSIRSLRDLVSYRQSLGPPRTTRREVAQRPLVGGRHDSDTGSSARHRTRSERTPAR